MIYLIIIEVILWFVYPHAMIPVAILYPFAREQKPPADTSNRINKAISLWFAMTRPYLFNKVPTTYLKSTWWGHKRLVWDCYVNEDKIAPYFKFMRQDVLEYMKYDL